MRGNSSPSTITVPDARTVLRKGDDTQVVSAPVSPDESDGKRGLFGRRR